MTDIVAKRERITPKRAEQLLNKNTCNRGLRAGLVEKYAADMKSGRWTECAADIVIYDTNEIADGQHRLYAIIESGTTQEFFVKTNFPKGAAMNVDTGRSRTFQDNKLISQGVRISKPAIAACRWIAFGESSGNAGATRRPLSYSETDVIVEKYGEFAEKGRFHLSNAKSLSRASVVAAIARAYMNGEPEDALKRFAEVYSKGFSNGEHESAAIALRNAVLQHAARGITNALAEREMFLKAQNAVHYFVKGKKLTVIKTIEAEAYPLPKVRVRK